MRDYDEIELPRFSREITLNRSQVDERSNETPNELAGLLKPFTGVLDLEPTIGRPGFLDLTFAVLQPLVIERFSERIRQITQTTPPDSRSNQVPRTRRDIRGGSGIVHHRSIHQNSESAPVPIEPSAPSTEVRRALDRPTVIERFAERTRRTDQTLITESELSRRETQRNIQNGLGILVHRISQEDLESALVPIEPSVPPIAAQRTLDRSLIEEGTSEQTRRITQTASPDKEPELIEGPETHRELTVAQALRNERETERSGESRIHASLQGRDGSKDSTWSQHQRTVRETASSETTLTTRRQFLRTGREPSGASDSPTTPRSVADVRVSSQPSSTPSEGRPVRQDSRAFQLAADRGTRGNSITPGSTPVFESRNEIRRTETENRNEGTTDTRDQQLRRHSPRTESPHQNSSGDSEYGLPRRERDVPNRERTVPFSPVSRNLTQMKGAGKAELNRPQSEGTITPDSSVGATDRPSSPAQPRTESEDSPIHRSGMTVLNREGKASETDDSHAYDPNDGRTTVGRASTSQGGNGVIDSVQAPTSRSPNQDSNVAPEMTLKQDRSNEAIERETTFEDDSTEKLYEVNGNTNRKEETTYSFTSSSQRHMNQDLDLEHLVDRVYTKFERKLQIERERRGL